MKETPMLDEYDLTALLQAYSGDTLARKALIDALEEAGDPRLEAVRAEAVDWDGLAQQLADAGKGKSWWAGTPQGQSYYRWLIDCARYGSATRQDVTDAVRQARREWLQGLFPEVRLG
jgi:hypothetical protein